MINCRQNMKNPKEIKGRIQRKSKEGSKGNQRKDPKDKLRLRNSPFPAKQDT